MACNEETDKNSLTPSFNIEKEQSSCMNLFPVKCNSNSYNEQENEEYTKDTIASPFYLRDVHSYSPLTDYPLYHSLIKNALVYSDALQENTEQRPEYKVRWANHAPRVVSYVSSLLGDISSSDVIFVSQEKEEIHAHRIVIASASPYLKNILMNAHGDLSALIVMPRCLARVITAMVFFCYTGVLRCCLEDVTSVFELAEALEILGILAEKKKYQEILPLLPIKPPSTSDLKNLFNNSLPLMGHLTSPDSRTYIDSEKITDRKFEQTEFRNSSWLKPGDFTQKRGVSKTPEHDDQLPVEHNDSPVVKDMFRRSNDLSKLSQPSSYFDDEVPEKGVRNSIFKAPKIIPQSYTGSRVLLWRFLMEMLHDHRYSPFYIRWLDRPNGIFRIMESDKVAQLWGMARKNNNMTYEKMSRGMRTYYKRSIMFHLDGTKLIYRFNTEDSEIQQQMKYYEMMGRAPMPSEFPNYEDPKLQVNPMSSWMMEAQKTPFDFPGQSDPKRNQITLHPPQLLSPQ